MKPIWRIRYVIVEELAIIKTKDFAETNIRSIRGDEEKHWPNFTYSTNPYLSIEDWAILCELLASWNNFHKSIEISRENMLVVGTVVIL